jgi:hypothetical protein
MGRETLFVDGQSINEKKQVPEDGQGDDIVDGQSGKEEDVIVDGQSGKEGDVIVDGQSGSKQNAPLKRQISVTKMPKSKKGKTRNAKQLILMRFQEAEAKKREADNEYYKARDQLFTAFQEIE